MKPFDEECPVCGTLNRHLFLEETGGWFECINCKSIVRAAGKQKKTGKHPSKRCWKPGHTAVIVNQ